MCKPYKYPPIFKAENSQLDMFLERLSLTAIASDLPRYCCENATMKYDYLFTKIPLK